MSSQLPSLARIVIIGGGIAGNSVAYHLAKLGQRDVVLLEQDALTSGTTWHAAGLLAQLRSNETQTRLARYSMDLYGRLEEETGQATGLRRSGTLMLAQNEARWTELKRRHSDAKKFELETHLVGPKDAGELWSLMHTDDLVGGLFIPSDGQIDPTGVTTALAKGARNSGVRICENVKVTDIETDNNRISAVLTDHGRVRCEIVVNCGGIWARALAEKIGATVPLQAVEHMYLVTEPMTDLKPGIPSLRDYDSLTYFKEDAGKLIMGGSERDARPWAVGGIPKNFHFSLLDEDWSQFQDLIEGAVKRIPQMADVGIRQLLNGPESFTPDGQYLLGETLEIENFFVAAGFNSTGITASGGAGRALAEWIVEGSPTMDLQDVDVRRFHPFQGTRRYLDERVRETVSTAFDMHWPFRQAESARGIRKSPLHHQLMSRNACFGEKAGWERPNWFAPAGVEASYAYSFGRQNWFPYAAAEHQSIRERVGLIDITSFTKFKLEGPDALPLLQRLCTKELDVPLGRVVYTLMLNQRGGVECDMTITRLTEQAFLIYCGAGEYGHVLGWIRAHLIANQDIYLSDVTGGMAVIAVMGPQSRTLLNRVTTADLSNDGFPFLSSKVIDVGFARCRASRVTFVGELGWELNIPTEFAASVYDTLLNAGDDLGLSDVGYHALDSLRIERGYRHFGQDMNAWDTPLEAGLNFAVDFKKGEDFIGRPALETQRVEGLCRRLVTFVMDNPDPVLLQGEPVWRNGQLVGDIPSAAFGHTVGRPVGLGYVKHDKGVAADFIEDGEYEIEIASKRFPATATLAPPYDPKGARVRM